MGAAACARGRERGTWLWRGAWELELVYSSREREISANEQPISDWRCCVAFLQQACNSPGGPMAVQRRRKAMARELRLLAVAIVLAVAFADGGEGGGTQAELEGDHAAARRRGAPIG